MGDMYKVYTLSEIKKILSDTEHYVTRKVMFTKEHAIKIDDRYIVKAGTIYPSNDATAMGVALYDIDVTDMDDEGSLLIHGFVCTKMIPEKPSKEATEALTLIYFE